MKDKISAFVYSYKKYNYLQKLGYEKASVAHYCHHLNSLYGPDCYQRLFLLFWVRVRDAVIISKIPNIK